jgi:crotonobetainyl-CoA:carnitine CoA-transferase CaiB-like acyl-CoA transferase
MIVQMEHPALGMARSIGNPIQFSETPVSYRLPPPLLGEHTEAVLRELGYSEEDVRRMSRAAAV